jgi:hypothetical protein
MAFYTADGWQGTNYSLTDFRHSENDPYIADEFADAYPLKDEEYGRVDRNITQEISVKVEDGKVVKTKTNGCKDGSDWKCFTLDADTFGGRNGSGYSGHGLGAWAQNAGFDWNGYKDDFKPLAESLEQNRTDNISDQETRDEHAFYNANTRPTEMQNAADAANTAGDQEAFKREAINAWSEAAITWAESTQGGRYLENRANILNTNPGGQSEYLVALEEAGIITGVEREQLLFGDTAANLFNSDGTLKSDKTLGGLMGSYRTYYANDKVSEWDYEAQGLQPPVGGFNATYYLNANEGAQNLRDKWDSASGAYNIYDNGGDNLDLTVRYGSVDNYAWNNYSTVGKSAGYRGNAAQATAYSDAYEEDWNRNFTDAERQNIRDNQLGLTGFRESGGELIRTVDWEDETGGTLEKVVNKEVLSKELTEQDRFKGLGLDMMQATIDELNKVKAQQQELDIYKGLPGFDEIFSINSTLSNSILGDSGVGGLLGMMGTNTSELMDSFEEQLGQVTGINFGSAEYNWQKWYNDTLIKDLEEKSTTTGYGVSYDEETGEVEIGDERTTVYELEQDFKTNFIDNYVKPRFDLSKSMDEFVSYIDTIDKETEQNIFQTQSAVNALRDIAALRAENYYAALESGSGYDVKTFDPTFYAEPTNDEYGTVNETKRLKYVDQQVGFALDWDAAKNRPNNTAYELTSEEAEAMGLTGGRTSVTWAELAYYYGVDVNDRDQFAKLHYENIGRGRGYDPARDVVTQSDIEDFVNNNVLSAVQDADADFGDSPFLAFVTPTEFADAMLEGIDPTENEPEWQEILELYGLDESTASLEEVREIILETVMTGEAKAIREGIKYLNQKKLRPTQDRLGISYIEREEDYQPTDDPDADALFQTFQAAGYAGTQEEFYETFMPDTDRSDIELITLGMDGLTLDIGDLSDPFEALGALGGLLGEGDNNLFGFDDDNEDEEREPSYFDLFADEKDYEDDYASDTGRGFIDDFTSFFK